MFERFSQYAAPCLFASSCVFIFAYASGESETFSAEAAAVALVYSAAFRALSHATASCAQGNALDRYFGARVEASVKACVRIKAIGLLLRSAWLVLLVKHDELDLEGMEDGDLLTPYIGRILASNKRDMTKSLTALLGMVGCIAFTALYPRACALGEFSKKGALGLYEMLVVREGVL